MIFASAIVAQDSRDMCGSHVMGPTTWVPRETHSMFLVSCTTVVQETFLVRNRHFYEALGCYACTRS
jgi:hypothetical protein